MSDKKVNSKMLKNLIKEVLTEQTLDEKVTLQRTTKKNISKKSFPTTDWTRSDFDTKDWKKGGNIDAASSLDGNSSDFSPEDVAQHRFQTKDDAFYDRVKLSTLDVNFEDEMRRIWDTLSTGGSSGGTFFFKVAGKPELKTGFHYKNNSKKGKMGAIATEMQNIIDRSGITNGELTDMLAEVTAIFSGDFGSGKLDQAVTDTRAAIGSLPPAAPAPDALKTRLRSIAAALKTAETQDIAAPVIQDVGSAAATFPPGLITPLNDLFSGQDTFDKRLKKLSSVSELLLSGDDNRIDTAYLNKERELLRDIIIMDYFSTIMREVDDRAIAYFFEALGALLGGGNVAGSSGESGDFTVAIAPHEQEFEGSSKFVQGNSTQSVSGFKAGVPVLYLVAKKNSTDIGERTIIPMHAYTIQLNTLPAYNGAGTGGDPGALDVSTFPAGLWKGAKSTASNIGTSITATAAKAQQNGSVHHGAAQVQANNDTIYRFHFGKNIVGTKYDFHFAGKDAGGNIENLKQKLNSIESKIDTDLNSAYTSMRDYFDSMKKSQAAIKDYIGSNNKTKGTAALNAMDLADAKLQGTVEAIGGTISNKRTAGAQNRVVSENKITSSFLKKLFKETLKK